MSADNWAVCPKCLKDVDNKVKSLYGKVSEEEYGKLIEEKQETEREQTLREDYEIWTNVDGRFMVKYSCSCSACGLKFEYNYSKLIYTTQEQLIKVDPQ